MPVFPTLESKEDVNYRAATDLDKSCSVCSSFTAPGTCAIVEGPVDKSFTCDKFSAESDPEAPAEEATDTAPEDTPGDN